MPQNFELKYRIVFPCGEVRWIQADGNPRQMLGTKIEITEHKELAAEVAFERHKLQEIFEGSPAAMSLWRGPDFVFEMVNPKYQAIYPDRELSGKPLLEALPELKNQPYSELLKRVLETGETFVAREMLAKIANVPDGELQDRYYDFSYIRIDDMEGKPYGVYNHAIDATDRVVARRKIEETIADLERERALREQFVNALTHDLRTPLAAARMSAQLALRDREDVTKREAMIHKVIAMIDRTDQMIHDLLDAHLIKAGRELPINAEKCDFSSIVRAAVEDDQATHGSRFILQIPKTLEGYWSCSGLRRIVDNLINNAVKYGSSDTPISVTLRETSGQRVALMIHNYGSEMNQEETRTLFELFKRTGSARASGKKGWGIGLTLVKGIVTAHGGEISVESAVGSGTTFIVVLPVDSRSNK